MPASLAAEEKALGVILKKETWTATKTYLGLSTLKASELLKKTTGKEFGEHEFKESEGWARLEADTIAWTVTKAEGETGFTIFENTSEIKGGGGAGEFKKITGSEEKTLETFAIIEETAGAKNTEESKILAFGTLTTKITVNKASTLIINAKSLKFECE